MSKMLTLLELGVHSLFNGNANVKMLNKPQNSYRHLKYSKPNLYPNTIWY